MKLVNIIREIKMSYGSIKAIKQDSDRKELMLLEFPGGEKEWFFFGGYYYAIHTIFSIHSPDLNEIQEYVTLFKKYGYPFKLRSERDFEFSSSIVSFESHIKKYSPNEQFKVDNGEYKKEDLDEIKQLPKIETTQDLVNALEKGAKNLFVHDILKEMDKLDDEDWINLRKEWIANPINKDIRWENIFVLNDDEDDLLYFSLDENEIKTYCNQIHFAYDMQYESMPFLNKTVYFTYY